jgi:voltage-dependent potassium channel beta subunit
MHYRRLGRTGLKVSEISLGAWITFGDQIERKTAIDLVHAAYDQGINFFDNADVYAAGQAEIVMGEAIRKLPRETLVISSKVFWPTMPGPNGRGLSRKHITESIEASLRRLGTDYVDLYYCHRYDPDTPIQEVVWTMNHLIQQGKILYWGTSEWEAAEIQYAIDVAERCNLHKPVVEQPVYNLFERHRFGEGYRHVYEDHGYGSTTWSPLASGTLTGKYQKGVPEGSRGSLESLSWLRGQITDPERLAKVAALQPLAEQMGATLAQFSIAWCLQNPWVSTVITGASRVEQVHENMQAVDVAERFTPDVMAAIDEIFA